jgi:hypothetical protein
MEPSGGLELEEQPPVPGRREVGTEGEGGSAVVAVDVAGRVELGEGLVAVVKAVRWG